MTAVFLFRPHTFTTTHPRDPDQTNYRRQKEACAQIPARGFGSGLALRHCGCRHRLRRSARRLRLRLHLQAAPPDRHACRLSSARAASRLERRRQAHRRVRGGAPRLRAPLRSARPRQARHSRRRGRRLLRTPRHRDNRHHPRRTLQRAARPPRPGRLDHHAAGCPQLLPLVRAHLHPQALRDRDVLQDRKNAYEGPDPRDLHEPDLSGSARLRLPERRTNLLRPLARPDLDRRGRHARGSSRRAFGLQPDRQSDARHHAQELRARTHARSRLHRRTHL